MTAARAAVASSAAASDHNAPGAINGPNGGSRDGPCEAGFSGGHGFIKLTQLAQAAPPPAPARVIEQPAPAPQPIVRPIRKDRN